jgi:sugar transferase EpsL
MNCHPGKRIFDLALSTVALFALAPLMVMVWLAVRLRMGAPVLFRQVRAGYQGRPFTLFKFRTMRVDCNVRGELLPDEDRLIEFGKFLRRYSFDELPQLWNVWTGDMSLVGPRPLLMDYLPRYSAQQARRHEAVPGITGWTQVNGRNSLDWQKKFELDVWYVDNRGFLLDIKILAKTIWKLLRQEGISQDGHATMPEFVGDDQTGPL